MKSTKSDLISTRDINFLLYEWLNVEELTKFDRYSHLAKQDFDAVLDLSCELAQDTFATHNRLSDLNEPTFDGTSVSMIPEIGTALNKFYDAGLLAASMPLSVDGGQLPHAVYRACFSFFQAANIATAAYPMLSAANANLLLEYGTAEQIAKYVTPMIDGQFFGTMCLSEPDAGSSLADVSTLASRHEDGSYRIVGNKMWISGGDHELSENIVHLVLARCPNAVKGVRGLSLFIVPKYLVSDDGSLGERNDVVLAGINHKMGYRGTVNAVLSFGGSGNTSGTPGAIGWLVGEENRGLEYMFHMMNEARIVVGASAAAVGYTSYLTALDYARTRLQGRLVDNKDLAAPQVPIVEHPDVRRMLLTSKSYVEGALALVLYLAKQQDLHLVAATSDEADRSLLLLDILTPVVKGWSSKWSLVANDYAIQIHGGYGYTRDYSVEQMWRDNRLNPIHEGTDGIQAIDLIGRKTSMQNGAALTALTQEIRATIKHGLAGTADLPKHAATLELLVSKLEAVTANIHAQELASYRIANASLYADALGHIVIGWMWLEQLLTCAGKTGAFYDGKRAASDYFYTYELAQCDSWLSILANNPNIYRDTDPASL